MEFVVSYFTENECELLEKEYINAHTKMKYKCKCNNVDYISWSNFKSGNRCNKCGINKTTEKKKHCLSFIKEQFSLQGCILLSDYYSDGKQMLDYICSCGTKAQIIWNNFQQGQRCRSCGTKSSSMNRKVEYDQIFNLFLRENCYLLTKKSDYRSQSSKVDYICSCGNIDAVTPTKFKQGERCNNCIGCSRGEKEIRDYLIKKKIHFTAQYKFAECKNINPLRFDFAIFDNNKQIKFLIEFDGRQHFEPVEIFGGDKYFEEVKHNDGLKNTYCKQNGISLIRIPYWDYKNIKKILLDFI
ncbi:very-short-patch-repair endonuclease [Paenibacillus jamilae]|nr:very-short-patch-repair endonuclease [Paenibacillus jamilae]